MLKFGGNLNGKFRLQLGTETTRLDLTWSGQVDLTAATLGSTHTAPQNLLAINVWIVNLSGFADHAVQHTTH